MKKLFLSGLILLFCLILSETSKAQSLDQAGLINQLVGKWQAKAGQDTVEIWDFKKYGPQSYIVEICRKTADNILPVSFNSISFDPMAGKFVGFTLLFNGSHGTWTGTFISERKFCGDMLYNLNPEPVFGKFENTLKNPEEWIWTGYINEGIKLPDLHFVKVK
jgi:hypothetical protein